MNFALGDGLRYEAIRKYTSDKSEVESKREGSVDFSSLKIGLYNEKLFQKCDIIGKEKTKS